MPRLRERGSEMPQRQSPRGQFQLRTSSSDSDPLHNRPTIDRSPKLGERRSPRGSHPDSVNQKKFGTRIADLESQLGQAQEELRKLKEQLASAEAAKKEAQEELQKKTKEPIAQNSVEEHGDHIEVVQRKKENSCINPEETPAENSPETDVFEVPISTLEVEPKIATSNTTAQEENGTNEKLLMEMSLVKDEVHSLKTKLEEKDKDVELLRAENVSLNERVQEAALELAVARAKEEETVTKLNQIVEELNESKANAAHLKKELELLETAKEELELETKKMRVQTDQWRKAADAAAAVLAGGTGLVGGRRISERCVSMDKNVINNNGGGGGGGYIGFEGSPIMGGEYSDDGFGGGGKRKGSSGIRMFGDLWKKKGQK